MITSRDNPKLKRVRLLQADAKARREACSFVVEGVRLVEEAWSSGWQLEWVIYSADLSERGRQLLDQLRASRVPLDEVSAAVLQSVSDTQSPQGILGVVQARRFHLAQALNFVLILDQVRDPGNLGTILRTAAAAGVQRVVLPPGNVDAFAPKVMRAGMGAQFRLPVDVLPWDQLIDLLSEHNLATYMADAAEGEPCYQADLASPLALIIGGEAEGASVSALQYARQKIHIPMPGGSESLNVAIAAGILLFEVVRQRNFTP